MSSPARSAVAVAASALLVAGLAACAPAEPEAQPQPTATPTPTETVAGPTPPGSRVPLACDALIAGLPGWTGTSAENVVFSYLPLTAAVEQSGFEYCDYTGTLGATPVRLLFMVGVEVDPAVVQRSIDFYSPLGYPTGFAGDLSYTECRAADDPPYCLTEVLVGGWLAQWSTNADGAVAADYDASLRAFAVALADRMRAWAPPPPAWVQPEGALAWAYDCEGEVGQSDGPIRATFGFPSTTAQFTGSGDGLGLFYTAERRQSQTICGWSATDESGANVYVTIAPGAEYLLDAGETLDGDPISYPGARAASVVDNPDYTNVSVQVVIDGSFIEVSYDAGYLSELTRDDEIAAALRVVDAIVATFGGGS